MFAPDVYSTFRGMSEGSSDGSMYRGEVSTSGGSSFPYSMRGSNEYRGKKMQVVQVTNHDDLIKRFLQGEYRINDIQEKDQEKYYIDNLKEMLKHKQHQGNLVPILVRDLQKFKREFSPQEKKTIILYFIKKYYVNDNHNIQKQLNDLDKIKFD